MPRRIVAFAVASVVLSGGCFRALDPGPEGGGVADSLLARVRALTGDEASSGAATPAAAVTPGGAGQRVAREVAEPAPPAGETVVDRSAGGGVDPGTDELAQAVAPGAGVSASAAAIAADGPLPPLPWTAAPGEPGDGSVILPRGGVVLADADPDAAPLGVIAAGTPIAVRERVVGEGCAQAWLGVAPFGYVCAEFKDSPRTPVAHVLPRVGKGRRIPGTYGRVAKGAEVFRTLADASAGVGGTTPGASLMVRRARQVQAGGRSFWKTSHGYIATSDIRRFGGSKWQGVALGGAEDEGPTLPLAWTLPEAMLAKVAVKAAPTRGAKVLRWLARRELVELANTTPERGYLALRDGGYVEAKRLAVADAGERPEAADATERWLDIDLAEQTLVAYEGDRPVYATMISSGKPGHSTPTGVFRLSRKVAERTMNSMADSKESYSVAKVPWTVYFATGYALHASYWHDGFGHRKSHGCVNLSPLDARALYAWTAPAVAPGWSEVFGHEDQPGSVVRIRSRRDPAPVTRGYAKAMLEATTTATETAAPALDGAVVAQR